MPQPYVFCRRSLKSSSKKICSVLNLRRATCVAFHLVRITAAIVTRVFWVTAQWPGPDYLIRSCCFLQCLRDCVRRRLPVFDPVLKIRNQIHIPGLWRVGRNTVSDASVPCIRRYVESDRFVHFGLTEALHLLLV